MKVELESEETKNGAEFIGKLEINYIYITGEGKCKSKEKWSGVKKWRQCEVKR